MSYRITVLRASRPNFLLLAPLCVLLGIAVAWRQTLTLAGFEIALVMLGGILAHAAVNLHNEYEDFRSGLDLITVRTPFSGGSGALPETPAAASEVAIALLVCLAGVAAIGLYFLVRQGWPLLGLGVLGLALVIGYTRWITRSPGLCLMAPGLGFGPVMVLGSLLALGGRLDGAALTAAAFAGLLVSELLLINQFPDVQADRRAGRRHLPIVLGLAGAARVVALLLLGAYGLLGITLVVGWLPGAAGLALLPLPGALWVARALPQALGEPRRLSGVLGLNVATLLVTLALLDLGLLIDAA